MSIEETVWKFLKGKNLDEKSIAAVMGNIYAESGFKINMIEAGSGIGFGLCQWSFERRKQLESYGTDLIHQLNFMWSELTGENTASTGASYQWIEKTPKYLAHSDFMAGKGSIADLTAAMCFSWERPNEAAAHLDVRQSKANEYYSQFTGISPDSVNSQSDAMTIESTNYQVVKGSEKYGDVLFGRRYRITVSDEGGTALDVSQLRCTFNIIKTIQMEPNLAEITIYNLNANTENAIMVNGKRITVEAGYEGSQFGLIFDGDILQPIRERENGTTFKLTLLALDSDRAINFDIANYSIIRGQTARSVVNYIANKAQYPINLGSISDKLEGQKLTRGKVMFGKSADYIRQIAKTYDLQQYTDSGSLNLVSLEELPEGEIFELSPTSGLIGTPEQTDYGISGKCLLNPQIKLNSLIHIDNSLVRAKRIDINGSNTAPNGGVATENSNNLSNARNAIISEAKRLCDDPNVRYSQELRGQTVNGITYHDCSSFTEHCYSIAGLSLNPTSQLQWAQVKAKGMVISDMSAALAGDIVFWFDGNGECYHVAIYGGNNDIYAARSKDKALDEQVSYGPIYGNYKIGRPESLISADGGEFPSANSNSNENTSSNDTSQTLFRGLDKDGIYRVIKITYTGDTRGQDWYVNFETIDQLGGAIATVSS